MLIRKCYTLSQKRIEEGGVVYLEDADGLVEDVIKESRINEKRARISFKR